MRSRSKERAGSSQEGAGDRGHRGRVGLGRRSELIECRGPRPVVRRPAGEAQYQPERPHLDRPEARQPRPEEIDLRPVHHGEQAGQELETVAAPDANDFRSLAPVRSLAESHALTPGLEYDPGCPAGLELETHRAGDSWRLDGASNRRGCCRGPHDRPVPAASAAPSRPGAARIPAASSAAARSSPRGIPRRLRIGPRSRPDRPGIRVSR